MLKKELGIYIHWPFCASLCPYCDFNRTLVTSINEKEWIYSFKKEIDYYLRNIDVSSYKVTSIFFGGGTPSLMPVKIIKEIISYIGENFNLVNNAEITLEANPTSTEEKKFIEFRNHGINRLSLGIQALNDYDLQFLGRNHSAAESLQAIKTASETFDNFSFDLIYCRHPQQKLSDWRHELDKALSLKTDHISLYSLTLEKGTEFYRRKVKGNLPIMAEETQEEMFLFTNDYMEKNGFERYEVSNYCQAGRESIHNMHYWKINDYMGIGPGAHGRLTYLDGKRYQTMTHHNYTKWLENIKNSRGSLQIEKVMEKHEQITEIFMGGLRIAAGVDLNYINSVLSIDLLQEISFSKIEKAIENELIIIRDNHIYPTEKGRNVLSSTLKMLLD